MIEIRTRYNVLSRGLDIYVLRRDFVSKKTELLAPVNDLLFGWQIKEANSEMLPTFSIPQESVPFLIEDLNRDGMGVDEGAESAVMAHKNDLAAILNQVLPRALRATEYP